MSARIDRGKTPAIGQPIPSARYPEGSSIDPLHLPVVDPALIAHLKRVFAPRLGRHYDLRDYDRQVGAQEVIDHLEQVASQAFDK